MGELIDFIEWKKKREEKEDNELKDDIEQLRLELSDMIKEMESEAGPYVYPSEMIELLPQLVHIDGLLDGYYDAWKDVESVTSGSHTVSSGIKNPDTDV